MPLEFSSEVKARIQGILARYPNRQAALLPVLHLVQRELGYLSIEAQSEVARELAVPATLVREVTTFYEMFREHPEGQYHLEFCTNISCHLAGADAIVEHVKKSLAIEVGHQTEDGVFSLIEAECLASCGSGPMLKVGLDYYEGLSIPAVDALLGRFRAEAPALQGKAYECDEHGPHVGPLAGFEPPSSGDAKAPVPVNEAASGAILVSVQSGSVTPNGEESMVASSVPAEAPSPASGEPVSGE